MSLSSPFVHLRVHSAYSLLEGALPLDRIVDYAVRDESPAIAVTDVNNLFGALEFAQKASKKGVQPLIGMQLDIWFNEEKKDSEHNRAALKKSDLFPVVLLSANKAGYKNLMKIISFAYLHGSSEEPVCRSVDSLSGMEEGIICLTGGECGPIGMALRQGRDDIAEKRLHNLHSLFHDRLYVELHRIEGYDENIESETLAFAYRLGLPLVATNQAFFENEDDFEAHDALLAIAEGSVVAVDERRRVSRDNRLKSSAQMYELFSDIPEALDNSLEIACRCSYYPQSRAPILPRFFSGAKNDQDALSVESSALAQQARDGLKTRLETCGLAKDQVLKDYTERLDYELCVIEKMNYSGYFLIVSDFIRWAKSHAIPVGPGRGSGAGSLVAYATMITDIDPLRFSLLFERFLNPDRISMPDFDIDFCQDRREEVIRYVQKKYGFDQVGHIITFGTLQARAVLRDVGRVLQMPYGQVDRLCKMIPQNPVNPLTLEKALEIEPRFFEMAQQEPVIHTLLSIARKLEGLYRHASTHAAGIVIADRPLYELVPMYRDPRSDMPVTQFNMKKVEDAGLIKFDFLGLKTLTVLQKTVELLARRNILIDLTNLPLDDQKTYDLLSRGDVLGVFQIESAGMRKALIGMKPDRIEDLIALVSLYRPGPLENIPTYNARKHGQEKVASIHSRIDHILSKTYGVIVYQEQVMQIAQELAGYSLAEADLLRRAMGKKIRSEMDSQRKRFVAGATERGVSQEQANFIFDFLAKFADYGFNKSHAAAYAIISYQTAYLKAHFPVEFIAASMTLDISNTDRLADFHRDALRLGLEVVAPSVSSSFHDFQVEGNRIYYALSAIKGIGTAAAEYIVQKRAKGSFSDLADFCQRVDPSIIGKRIFESLIMAGALDCFGGNRSSMMASVENMLALASRVRKDALSGQGDIFGFSGLTVELPALDLVQIEPWSITDRLGYEFQVIGFYLSAHPLDQYTGFLKKMRVQNQAEFSAAVKSAASAGRLAGTVLLKQERNTRTGNRIGIVTFSDSSGQYEAVLFSETLGRYGHLLEPGQSVVIVVLAENRPEGVSFRIQSVQSLQDELNLIVGSLRIYLDHSGSVERIASQLIDGGTGMVSLIILDNQKKEVEIRLPGQYKIDFSVVSSIQNIPGVLNVEML